MTRANIMIIGGGITGLSAAYYTAKRLEAAGISATISLVEQSEAVGGKINTLERDGFVIEKGPDSFLARKRPIIDLSKELGLEEELVGTNPKAKKTYIMNNGKLHPMPPGLVLGIPTEMSPFMRTGLISAWGKARAAMDLLLPKRQEAGDESLGHFLERRLGKEVLEHIAEPLLAGIYAGDTYSLSLLSTFPQFQAMEKKHRSIILGMMANRKKTQEEAAQLPPAARGSVFLTYRKGLQTLVRGLIGALEGKVQIRTGVGVRSLQRLEEQQIEVAFADGSSEMVDSLILAVPTYQAAKLLAPLPIAPELERIQYISVANVIMAFDEKDIPQKLDGSGFLIPRKEKRTITASTWTSSKWLHSAPKGKVLLRCYVGRSGEQDWLKWSDEELVGKVRKDVADMMGIVAEPLFYEITRMPQSMPQYPVGHLEGISKFRSELAKVMPGVWITGAGFEGVGLPDCIRQGNETAAQLVTYVQQHLSGSAELG
jgi:oxygen-dependent protoporphyrinogen oxidase